MRTQVAIIGGGPAGLLLSQILTRGGIDTVVIERQSQDAALAQNRAGILETGFVDLMHAAGASARLKRTALRHSGLVIADGSAEFGIDLAGLTGRDVVVYSQAEVTHDLYAARSASGGMTFFNATKLRLHDVAGDRPHVTFTHDGRDQRIDCDFIAGCDGFHGISRQTIPLTVRREYEKLFPFGWLGIWSESPPVHDQLIYAASARGFALCSLRSPALSRYYLQIPLADSIEEWSDTAFWDELRRRIPPQHAEALVTGPVIDKSIAPLRSFVTEPMRWGRLFLCGDAAHILPPTGAKGLNTAAGDVHYLSNALLRHYRDGDSHGIDSYSQTALARVWQAERFSWWMTHLLHRLPSQTAFDLKMQTAEIAFLRDNREAQAALAQNYVGLPY